MSAMLQRYVTRYPYTLRASATVDEARAAMLKLGVRHLPVLHGQQLVGVISERDVAFAERAGAGNKQLVDILSPDQVYAVDTNTRLFDVADTMAANKLGSAVVLEHGKVTGIFTTVDACRALADTLRKRP